MWKQLPIFVLLVLTLAACGGQQARNTVIEASPVTVAPILASPEDTVNKAIETMAIKDEAGLMDMFDSSVAMYAAPFAHGAIDRWSSLQDKVEPLSTIALGPIQSRQMQAPETTGQTTRVVVIVTHESGKAEWEFSLRERNQTWKLLNVNDTKTERKKS